MKLNKVYAWGKKLSQDIKEHEEQAPERKRNEIKKLKMEIETEKLKQQLRKIKNKDKQKDMWGI